MIIMMMITISPPFLIFRCSYHITRTMNIDMIMKIIMILVIVRIIISYCIIINILIIIVMIDEGQCHDNKDLE